LLFDIVFVSIASSILSFLSFSFFLTPSHGRLLLLRQQSLGQSAVPSHSLLWTSSGPGTRSRRSILPSFFYSLDLSSRSKSLQATLYQGREAHCAMRRPGVRDKSRAGTPRKIEKNEVNMDDGREGGVSMRESESASVDMVTRTIRIWRVRMIDTGGSGMAKGKGDLRRRGKRRKRAGGSRGSGRVDAGVSAKGKENQHQTVGSQLKNRRTWSPTRKRSKRSPAPPDAA
jgi:hypothetical protein